MTEIVDIQGDIEKYLGNLGVAIDKELVKALLDAALHAEGELKQIIMEVFKSGGTGQLARNPKATLLETKGEIKSSGAFMDLIYAGIQNKGGTIYPKSRKNLSIPLSAKAKTPGLWPRHWAKGKLFFIKSKAGNKLLVEKKGRGKLERHYLLRPSVTIKGKGYIARAARAAEAGIAEIIGDHIGISITQTEMPA